MVHKVGSSLSMYSNTEAPTHDNRARHNISSSVRKESMSYDHSLVQIESIKLSVAQSSAERPDSSDTDMARVGNC